MDAPTDPQFYADLIAFGRRTGIRPEDALYVWSSETALHTNLKGPSRTFSALMHPFAVPRVMSEEIWQRLPTMSAREQLPYVEAAIYGPAARRLGRPFRSTWEVYLANAAPALLRRDGVYSPETVMYLGSQYPSNWTMDNRSVAVPAYLAHAAGKSLPASYDVARNLVQQGALKGYVSLGDLRDFAKRLEGAHSGNAQAFDCAYAALQRAKGSSLVSGGSGGFEGAFYVGALGCPPASYVPDFDSQFSSSAPPDPTVATPETARQKTPGVSAPSLFQRADRALERGVRAIAPAPAKAALELDKKKWWIAGGLAAAGVIVIAAALGAKR